MKIKKIWLNHFECIENSVIKVTDQFYSNGVCYHATFGGKRIAFGYSNNIFWASTEESPITGSVKQRCKKIWQRKNK